MEIPFSRWYPAISIRRSRRQFDANLSISPELISNLQRVCAEFRPFPGARAELIPQAPDKIFKFIAGSYGFVKNARAALVFLGDINNSHSAEEAGYTGEGVVLEANVLGLSTCWTAGSFSSKNISDYINIRNNEKVLAVSPLGFAPKSISLADNVMAAFGRHSLRIPLSNLVSGLPENEWQSWIKPALEASRLAPSAMNRQPWRFEIKPKFIIISTDDGKLDMRMSKRLDCGIAMLHLEIAALHQGIKGYWQLLDEPQVASFNT